MTVKWAAEGCDRYVDPQTGVIIRSLTSGAMISNNIYGEQPYTDPHGQRVVIARSRDFHFDDESLLLVGDLQRLRVGMVDRIRGVRGVFNAAWSGLVYYYNLNGDLMRLNLNTLEKEAFTFSTGDGGSRGGSSVSPDQRYIIRPNLRPGSKPGYATIAIERVDLVERKVEVIFEHPEITNSHLQFNPITGRQILVQHNVGTQMLMDGTVPQAVTSRGVRLFCLDADGSNQRYYPVGDPHTARTTGHECFIADTGKALVSVAWDWKTWQLDSRYPEGNLFIVEPGADKPVVFKAPEHRFNHVSASRCGKYFVADSHSRGLHGPDGKLQDVALVVGNLQTGKYRTLVEHTYASGGGNQCTHTHPYLTADNRHVIYNSDQMVGVPQVYDAIIPDSFLASLD